MAMRYNMTDFGTPHGETELDIEYSPQTDTLLVNGVRYSGYLFRTLAWPPPDRLYRFTREGDNIVLREMGDAFPPARGRGP